MVQKSDIANTGNRSKTPLKNTIFGTNLYPPPHTSLAGAGEGLQRNIHTHLYPKQGPSAPLGPTQKKMGGRSAPPPGYVTFLNQAYFSHPVFDREIVCTRRGAIPRCPEAAGGPSSERRPIPHSQTTGPRPARRRALGRTGVCIRFGRPGMGALWTTL